ncbi:uncharacterized protein L199_000586 [Kwoniella botswanensis]|uniref:uncharacterized protein n=1 Tax=Kwoniella botswanensis TaxID=1268659 RepID=UPI00315D5845
MPRPDPSSLTLNHHKPLTTFAPYLTSLLQNVPTLQMRVANLSCYDHISKCKAKLTWRPLDEGGDGKSWKGVIQVDCTPGTLIDCRWTKHDQELINKERREWMVIPYDPGNWNYDDPDEIVRFSALRNQRQINEELSRLFENPSTTGTTGTSEVVGEKMNKQKTLDSTKIKEVNWRTNRPSEMSIDTIQTFGDTMEIPIGYNSMNRSDLTNNQLIGIDNKTEDEELTKVLFWSNRLINSLPFRKSCEEDEDEDNRAMFLSQFELKCQTWTKDDPHGYSFEVYIDQDQFPNGSASKNQNKAGPSDNPDWRSNRIWIRDYRKN